MHITYLHQYFSTPDGAGGTRSYEFGRRLVERGHQVRLITSSAFLPDSWAPTPGWHVRECAGMQVEVLRLPYSNRDAWGARLGTFARFAAQSAVRAASKPTDVVFASSTPLTIAVPGVAAKWRRRVPMVFEVRDLWPEMPIAVGALRRPLTRTLARELEGFAYRNAEGIVALSPGIAESILARGYPAAQLSVIPNACDRELFEVPEAEQRAARERHPWLAGRPLVVYAGTLGYVNGVGYLAEVARATLELDPQIRFLVIGDGAERASIEEKARSLGVFERNLFMLPPLPKRELAPLLASAHVATSLFRPIEAMWKNSANKFFDALAAHVPVAINHEGWLAALLRESGAGLVLDAHEPERAARDLARLLRDPERLASMRAAAAQLARTRFDRDVLASELEQRLLDAVQRASAD